MMQFVLAICLATIFALVYWVGYSDLDTVVTDVDVSSEVSGKDDISIAANSRLLSE